MNQSKLKKRRNEIGLTQVELAKKLGLTERGYQKLESKTKHKAIETAIRIAKTLNTTVEELFESQSVSE